MPLDRDSLQILASVLQKLDAGFSHLPQFTALASGSDHTAEVLQALAEKLTDNFPYFHPLYAGHLGYLLPKPQVGS